MLSHQRGSDPSIPSKRKVPGARRVAVLGTIVLSLVLAACSGGGSVAKTASTEDEKGKATITVWVAREQYLPKPEFYAAVKEKYPNITLKAEVQPDDKLFTQMQRMMAAKQQLPDLVQVDSFFAAPMYETGVALDLTNLVDRWKEEDPEGFSKLTDAVLDKDGKKVVGLGTTGSADVLYYRSDWLKQAGLTAPIKSWDGVLDALRAIKKDHPDTIPWAMTGTRGMGVNYLLSQMMASGVEFKGATPQLTSDAGKYVIEFYQTLIKEGLATTEALGWGENESRGAWIGGRSAFTLDGGRSSNDLGGAIQKGLKIKFGDDGWNIMIPPLALHNGDADSGVHTTATRTFHITSTSKNPYKASLILRLMTDTKQALIAAQSGALYLQKDVLADPAFRKTYPYLSDAEVNALANGASFPSGSTFFAVVEVLERMVQDIIKNPDTDSSALADKWQKELDKVSAK